MSYIVISRQQFTVDKKKRRKLVAKICVFGVIVGIVCILCGWWNHLNRELAIYSRSQAVARTTLAVNQAVAVTLKDCTYDSFVTTRMNSDGDIVALSANVVNVNSLALKTSIATQNKLNQIDKQVSVRIGTLSKIPLFTDCGPLLFVDFVPIGSVRSDFSSEFISAGINQTVHRIYINIRTTNKIVVAGHTENMEITTPVLVCESLIIGKIPQTYFGANLFEEK